MQISQPSIDKTCPEVEVFESVLSLDHQDILEIGCGDATLTRLIASGGAGRIITATEVDAIQHRKNLRINDLPNVNFMLAGCEDIPIEANSIDTVFMFKSLHHVAVEAMDKALLEIARVLKSGGAAYISEPVFAGDFNEILRLFHDEQHVRTEAFEALRRAVDQGIFLLRDELFFKTPVVFESFEQFHDRVIGVTHSDHNLSDELTAKVRAKFDSFFAINQGKFLNPIRVDLLQKP